MEITGWQQTERQRQRLGRMRRRRRMRRRKEDRDERIKVVDTLAPLPDWEMTLNLLIHPPAPTPPSFLTYCSTVAVILPPPLAGLWCFTTSKLIFKTNAANKVTLIDYSDLTMNELLRALERRKCRELKMISKHTLNAAFGSDYAVHLQVCSLQMQH